MRDDVTIGPEGSQVADIGAETVPGSEGSDAAAFEHEGEKYSRDQILEALEAHKDRDAWNSAYKQRDQRLGGVRKAVEAGFGKPVDQFTQDDLSDIQAFGIINSKLRSDPGFAKSWEDALITAYRASGATPKEAKVAAREDVVAAKAGEEVKIPQNLELPKEIVQRLKTVDDMESMIVEQGLSQFQERLEGEITGALEKVAKDLGVYSDFLREQVLQKLWGRSDRQLLEEYRDGQLQRDISEIARTSAKKLRDYLNAGATTEGRAAAAAKGSVGPAPVKGAVVAERVETHESRQGAGVRRFSDKFFKDFVGKKAGE